MEPNNQNPSQQSFFADTQAQPEQPPPRPWYKMINDDTGAIIYNQHPEHAKVDGYRYWGGFI